MKPPHMARSSTDVKWSRPPNGWLKCNVDAGVLWAYGMIGLGVVLRDCHGSFVVTRFNAQYFSVLTPSVAKALSFREALKWLKRSWNECDVIGIRCSCNG